MASKKSNMVIPITCRSEDMIHIDEFIDLQGALKKRDNESYQKIKSSIIKYGFRFPVFYVFIDKSKYILDGHGRIETVNRMINEGFSFGENNKLPSVRIEAKDKKEAAEILLALNSHYGRMDAPGLNEFMNEYDIEIGDISDFFDPVDFSLDEYMEEFGEISINDDDNNIEDIATNDITETENEPEFDAKTIENIVIKENDIICIGTNTILCAETNKNNVKKLIGNKNISFLIATPEDDCIDNAIDVIKAIDNCASYVIPSVKKFGYTYENISKYVDTTSYCVWNKLNHRRYLKNEWSNGTELLIYGVKGNILFDKSDEDDCLNLFSFNSSSNTNSLIKDIVPVSLVLYLLSKHTIINSNILDLFGNIGATLIAAEKTKRNAFVIEKNPLLVQNTIDRWASLTNSDKVKINGKDVEWSKYKET